MPALLTQRVFVAQCWPRFVSALVSAFFASFFYPMLENWGDCGAACRCFHQSLCWQNFVHRHFRIFFEFVISGFGCTRSLRALKQTSVRIGLDKGPDDHSCIEVHFSWLILSNNVVLWYKKWLCLFLNSSCWANMLVIFCLNIILAVSAQWAYLHPIFSYVWLDTVT